MKNNLLGKTFLSCSFYLYRFRKHVSYGFPIITFCNPGVHYEKPCICNLPHFGTGFGNELLQLSNTLDFEGTKHRETVIDFILHFSYDFFLIKDFTMKILCTNCTVYSRTKHIHVALCFTHVCYITY
jgi:hypothetical protein